MARQYARPRASSRFPLERSLARCAVLRYHDASAMLDIDTLRGQLLSVFSSAPPGRTFQAAMCPPWRLDSFLRGDEVPSGSGGSPFRRASVLILLYPGKEGPRFPLIVRSGGKGPHAGQVALPGGGVEDGESGGTAALREAEEELGVVPECVELLGALTSFPVDVSRYAVTPYVGIAAAAPEFRPAPAEVAAWFPVGCSELLDPGSIGTATVAHGSAEAVVPCYRFSGHVVWGATAIALAEFAEGLRRAAGFPSPAGFPSVSSEGRTTGAPGSSVP